MGATQFTHVGNHPDPTHAFIIAVEEARYLWGYAGETGTIAEKNEYKITHSDPVTIDEAQKMSASMPADEEIDDKWGPAGAIRVQDEGIDGWFFYGWAND